MNPERRPDATNRKPRLLDLLILIAGVSFGLASVRFTLTNLPIQWFQHLQTQSARRPDFPKFETFDVYLEAAMAHGMPLLAIASATVVALTVRPPCPSAQRLGRRPGFVLCLAALTGSLLAILIAVLQYRFERGIFAYAVANLMVSGLTSRAGWAVLGAWAALGFLGRARPYRTAIDHVGYGLGCAWVALFLTRCLAMARQWGHL